MSNLTIQPPRVPFVDPQSGMITREWYRFIADLFTRVGGSNSINLDALTTLFNALAAQVDGDEQAPPAVPAIPLDDLTPVAVSFAPTDDMAPLSVMDFGALDDLLQIPALSLAEAVEFLQTEVRSLAEQLVDAINQINELKQGTII